MAWTLRYTQPNTNKFWIEYTYAETVKVRDGIAIVQTLAARDFLLKSGFEIVPDKGKEELIEEVAIAA